VRASRVPAEVLGVLAAEFRKIAQVELVQVDTEWAGTLASVVRWMTFAQWVLMAMFGIVIVAVTFGAARTQVLADRDEIAVARLIGATNAFVRRPFMLRGALLGLLGGTVALTASVLATWMLGGMFHVVSAFFPGPAVCGLAVGLPAVLGGFGGWWCAHRSLDM
jgi:cell division transport system permease protein